MVSTVASGKPASERLRLALAASLAPPRTSTSVNAFFGCGEVRSKAVFEITMLSRTGSICSAADDASIALHLEQGTIYIDGRMRHTSKTSILRVVGVTGAYDRAHGKVVFRYLTETSAALQIAIS